MLGFLKVYLLVAFWKQGESVRWLTGYAYRTELSSSQPGAILKLLNPLAIFKVKQRCTKPFFLSWTESQPYAPADFVRVSVVLVSR